MFRGFTAGEVVVVAVVYLFPVSILLKIVSLKGSCRTAQLLNLSNEWRKPQTEGWIEFRSRSPGGDIPGADLLVRGPTFKLVSLDWNQTWNQTQILVSTEPNSDPSLYRN